MSGNAGIETLNTKKYSDILRIGAQKTRSVFRQGSISQSCTGESANVVDFVGKASMRQRTTRGAQKTIADPIHTTRWIAKKSYVSDSDLIDSDDKKLTLIDPTSAYVERQAAAANRIFDDDFITALTGPSLTGKDAVSTTSLPSTNIISASALTIGQILAGLQLMQENEVILDPNNPRQLFYAMSPANFTKFVQLNEVSNKDYGNEFYSGATYMVGAWMGINIIIDNNLAGATTARETILWEKSGMTTGIWDDIRGTITQDDNREGEPMLATTYMDLGFTRTEEEKVVKILIDETA